MTQATKKAESIFFCFEKKQKSSLNFQFKSNTEMPWGITLDMQTWEVHHVELGQQGDSLGVKTGWILTEVDGMPCQDNQEEVKIVFMMKF